MLDCRRQHPTLLLLLAMLCHSSCSADVIVSLDLALCLSALYLEVRNLGPVLLLFLNILIFVFKMPVYGVLLM